MKQLDMVVKNQHEVLAFLKSRFPMFHFSNFFFRDVQYGIQMFLKEKGMPVGYADAETVAHAFVESLVKSKVFRPIDQQSWMVDYPEYRTPQVKPPVAAKPAAPTIPAPQPAKA